MTYDGFLGDERDPGKSRHQYGRALALKRGLQETHGHTDNVDLYARPELVFTRLGDRPVRVPDGICVPRR